MLRRRAVVGLRSILFQATLLENSRSLSHSPQSTRSTPECLPSLSERATNVASSATTPRLAPLPTAFATTQPNHESSECPLPRTTEAKQCYHCQGLGHVQADCPTLRLSGAGSTAGSRLDCQSERCGPGCGPGCF
ncbi:hypothetical protein B0H66DRAFT_309078 [Apodospora peruviana]|uniref:CCHC-type domain-containing protein n=1 Tax=Apodospora peruviana TaxID=516989 RepID=A0AAE0I2D5_9PEZI|nr:hypothetical protein B0H66DRAFT_309078 [Apodospora peruviana]